ncbi:MAG: tetratricopeptide repeat protein [Synergistaceae bacterium]|nr:tetratricopeptide repeat protein [Synergistaceae bacterium]
MRKIMSLSLLVLTVLALLNMDVPLNLGAAYANGVIVTELEEAEKPKAAPKKPKKAPKPPPEPQLEVVEVITLPDPLEEALVLIEQRYFTKATKLLLQIVEAEPLNANAWYALGRAYRERGFFPESQRAFRRTLELDPSFSELSRFLEYPTAGDRQPLWDPSRPARIEEIPVAIDGFTIMPPSYEESALMAPIGQEAPVQLYQPFAPPPSQSMETPPQDVPPPPQGHQKKKTVPVRVVQPGAPLPPPGAAKKPPQTPKDETMPLPAYTPPPPEQAPAMPPPSGQEVEQPAVEDLEGPAYMPPPPTPGAPSPVTSPDLEIEPPIVENEEPVYTPPPPSSEGPPIEEPTDPEVRQPDIEEIEGPVYLPPPPADIPADDGATED